MGFSSIVKNKFDNNDYRVSIVPVHKRVSIPNAFKRGANQNEFVNMMGAIDSEPERFDNIIFEAAIFSKKNFYKPLFIIELDGIQKDDTEEKFKKLISHIVTNERIEDLRNFQDELSSVYRKYGFVAIRWDMWQLLFLSKIRVIFIFEVPYKG